jgi:lipoprotein-releasing system permease protein
MSRLPFELRIGLRYTRVGRRSRRRNRFISFISATSITGIVLGVAALIIVLSVMNGFIKEVRERMLAAISHVEVFAVDGALADPARAEAAVRAHPSVLAAASYLNGQGLFVAGDIVRPVLLRGVDPAREPEVSDVVAQNRAATVDRLVAGEFGVLLGVQLARQLGVQPGDRLALLLPQGDVSAAPKLAHLTVAGSFEVGHYEFDSALAMLHLADAQQLLGQPGPAGLRLRLRSADEAPLVAAQLAGTLDAGLLVRDWSRQNPTYFAAVQAQKRMMFLILVLIVAVAAFNLVSTLIMTVTEKQADIAILRTLGASPGSVMLIFVVQGALVGVLGTLAGVALGLLVASQLHEIVPVIEAALGAQLLPKEVYFINGLPSDPRASDVVPVALIALLLSLAATIYPSWRASRTRPAQALRYE